MNKELKALKTIIMYCDEEMVKNEISLIANALKNYEEGINNAKTYVKHTSSQALYDLLGLAIKNVDKSFWKLPEQLYDDVNKSLEALEIIRKTRVDTNIIKESKNYDDYCGLEAVKMLALIFNAPKQTGITKEEYDLLKEIL